MYIRGLIPRNFAESEEVAPIDCVDAQADLSLRKAHMPTCIFSGHHLLWPQRERNLYPGLAIR